MKAAHDAGLKVRFATAFLDQPGNIANAGEIALGDYLANSYVNGAGDPTFAEKYKAAVGHYPVFVEPQTVFAIGALQLALAKLDFHGGPINVTDIAKALENVTYMSPVGPISVRKEDHQTIRPVVVSKVVKNPKYPADGTDLGFQAVSTVAGPDAIYPVQASCQMKRPT
jgi:branched-chain amino acid transport system substrate-binding protein